MRPKATTTAEIPECTARWHGTRNAKYGHGCVCPGTLRAALRYDKQQKTGRLPARMIDATGTRRRVQAMAVNGRTTEEIGDAIGCNKRHVLRLFQATEVTVEIAAAVRSAEWLATTPAPSNRNATYARRSAERQGWWPLDAWFDVDTDPEPSTKDEITLMHAVGGHFCWDQLTDSDQRAAVQALVERGLSDTLIAEKLHTTSTKIGRARQRLGLNANPHERRRRA